MRSIPLAPSLTPATSGRPFALWRPDLDREAQRLVTWRTGLHRPGGPALTRWMMQRLMLERDAVLAHVTPHWGNLMVHVMGPTQPRVRLAVVGDGEPMTDPRYTLWRRGTPADTGLVVGSLDAVVGEGVVDLGQEAADACVAEASRVLRPGGQLAFHVPACREGSLDRMHPNPPGRELLSPRGWARVLKASGLTPTHMEVRSWRWPSWGSLALESGVGECLRRGLRLRRLVADVATPMKAYAGGDVVGLAICARRR